MISYNCIPIDKQKNCLTWYLLGNAGQVTAIGDGLYEIVIICNNPKLVNNITAIKSRISRFVTVSLG